MDADRAVTALGALAQEHRLALFRLLVQAGDDGMAAGAIAEALGIPNSSLSFHLAQLTMPAGHTKRFSRAVAAEDEADTSRTPNRDSLCPVTRVAPRRLAYACRA